MVVAISRIGVLAPKKKKKRAGNYFDVEENRELIDCRVFPDQCQVFIEPRMIDATALAHIIIRLLLRARTSRRISGLPSRAFNGILKRALIFKLLRLEPFKLNSQD